MGQKRQILTKDLVLTALAAALLSAGKQALASIPNVEVVTLLIMLYAACFKPQIAFTATAVFIFIECFIWGLNTWVVAYLIHWNFVAFATFLLARVFKVKNRFIYLAFTILVTAAFGVLTTTIDAIVSASKSRFTFGAFFVVIYMRGIYFYIVHVVGNAVFNITLFAPLRDILNRLMIKYYGKDVFLKEEKMEQKAAKPKRAEEGKNAMQLTAGEECDTIMLTDLSQRESSTITEKKE